uniref:uncharacterized protein LOC131126545 isoform X2 n=1 Tax=Doryrhamphus excisus TaxID=161450 RepID=UPI0025AE4ACB|nr:uncharacterized protein LOC131126545 isoform X2 [Doryrhamphus excisus]XP_057925184.1 uncharacterized protein LOC131126545 isoform X2 [Doryrhamphus excisus]
MKRLFFPGRISVVFRKGPLGFLLQDPTEEARQIKDNPSRRDKSPVAQQEVVRQNALAVVRQRGGDASDQTEVLGEYILQFGKYKGMSFRWLLENDMGYTVYLIQSHQREEAAGVLVVDGHSKDSLLSFLRYALSFKEINTLLEYESLKTSVPAPAAEDDQLVGFGARASNTWREIWESRDDGYAAFILRRKCATGTKMHKLQQYLQKQQQQPSTSFTIASTCSTTTFAESTAKDEDEELEKAMLSISPAILSGSAPPTLELLRFSVQVTEYELIQPTRGHRTCSDWPRCTRRCTSCAASKDSSAFPTGVDVSATRENKDQRRDPTACPRNCMCSWEPVASTLSASEPQSAQRPHNQPPVPPTAVPPTPPPQQFLSFDQEVNKWNCTHQQKIWMKLELESMGLWPGSRPVNNLLPVALTSPA